MMTARFSITLLFVLFCLVVSGFGDEIILSDSDEARARSLFKEIRCVVCQNQSIDDSNAGIARDLRFRIRDEIRRGRTDDEIEDSLVSIYGEFVLMEPRFGWHTVLLWLSPLLFFGIGIIAFWRLTRR